MLNSVFKPFLKIFKLLYLYIRKRSNILQLLFNFFIYEKYINRYKHRSVHAL